MNFKKLSTALVMASAFIAGSVSAGIILPTDIAILEDDNLEYITDANGAIKTTGTLAVGDTLHAFIGFQSVLDGSNNLVQNLGAPGTELTGISAIQIKAITDDGVLIFGADASFEATYGSGAVAALFSQTSGDFSTACTTIAACTTQATNGDDWMTIGFGDLDDFWISDSALPGVDTDDIDLTVVAGMAATSKVAVANYALSILDNQSGYLFEQQYNVLSGLYSPTADDYMVDIIGSGDVLGGAGLTSPFLARSDFDFQLVVVPEPASLALLGLGLIGMASIRRRKS